VIKNIYLPPLKIFKFLKGSETKNLGREEEDNSEFFLRRFFLSSE